MRAEVKKELAPAGPAEDKRKTLVFIGAIIVLFALATWYTRFSPFEALTSSEEFWKFIWFDFLPPRFGNWEALLASVLQTIEMAIASTGISAVIAFVLSLLGSTMICKIPVVPQAVRGIASVLRNIPALVWAFVLVMAFGIGTHVGIIALILATVSFLVRAYIETVDEVAAESFEALKACGAGKIQIIFQGIVPSAMPGFISWFLYCIETNIRASAILGMVGAGGIGLLMMSYIKQFRYQDACGVILVIAAVVILVNWLTEYLRKRVIS